MEFLPTKFDTAWLIKTTAHHDERGFFARTWCQEEFRQHGLSDRLIQCSVSYNKLAGTLRGMHFQAPPRHEVKVVRCTHGAIFDVIVDCRAGSRTRGQWEGFLLNDENHDAVYVPEGFAHGFQTLQAATEVFYQMNEFHQPSCARGFHHLDTKVGIRWPTETTVVSEQDQRLVSFEDCLADLDADSRATGTPS